jgi:hypothetical protein
MADQVRVEYDKAQTKQILRAFKAMDDEAVAQSKKMGFELAQYALGQIQGKASTLQERRISLTGRASKSSKIGEFSFGYQKTAFSGGANTSRNTESAPPYGKGILAGIEFGSSRKKNFRPRTARYRNGGNSGYWINPTLRSIQPRLIDKWERSFTEILKKGK